MGGQGTATAKVPSDLLSRELAWLASCCGFASQNAGGEEVAYSGRPAMSSSDVRHPLFLFLLIGPPRSPRHACAGRATRARTLRRRSLCTATGSSPPARALLVMASDPIADTQARHPRFAHSHPAICVPSVCSSRGLRAPSCTLLGGAREWKRTRKACYASVTGWQGVCFGRSACGSAARVYGIFPRPRLRFPEGAHP
jgi:hypothetical protein